MSYSKQYLRETTEILTKLDPMLCEKLWNYSRPCVGVEAGFSFSAWEAAQRNL